MSLRIGLDMDGVLADFRTAFHQCAERCLKRDVTTGGSPGSGETLAAGDVKQVWDYIGRTPNCSAPSPFSVSSAMRPSMT